MRNNRLTVVFNRTHKLSAIKNSKIYCEYAKAKKGSHKRSQLFFEIDGQEVLLNGAQIRSLKKVLNSACK
jgi:hypothetical protein